MKLHPLLKRLFIVTVLLGLCSSAAGAGEPEPLSRIAFGSCAKQNKPQPIWDSVVASQPDMFLFIGDNIYGDTADMDELRAKWELLGQKPGYQKLKQTCPIQAIWDDHDYGKNDAGRDYSKRKDSQQVFLDFFDEPKDSPRRKQEGIYDAKIIGPPGQRVQIILLDTRYFRSPLVKLDRDWESGEGYHGPYGPNLDPSATLLGEKQWQWLEKQLKKPAELRIVASSIQVVPNEHWWEKWGNFPLERERLFRLIDKTGANGVVFISGDRHHAEISRLDEKVDYPLFDITSSSLNQPSNWRNEINPHRCGIIYPEENFGTIDVDWSQDDPLLRLQVRNLEGEVVLQEKTRLSQLQPADE